MRDSSRGSGESPRPEAGRSLSQDEVNRVLRRCGFFAATPESALIALAGLTEQLRVAGGETLFEKGDVGTAMYFVLDGTIRVHQGDVVIGRLEAGEVFGEVAALSGEARSASITAERDTWLLKLEQEAIYSTLKLQPEAARSLIEALCARERQIIDEKFDRIVAGRVLEREMEIGQRIQQNFLPEAMPQVDGWSLDGVLKPARMVAGDFFDFFFVPAVGRFGIVIGDVCDKGVGAALFMTLFRSLLRSGALHRFPAGSRGVSDDPAVLLHQALTSTNDYIAATHAASSMFASVFFGLLDPETGELVYINAGHEPPVVATAAGVRARLETTGPVIGLFEGLAYRVESISVLPGEALFGYTDGATDARNESGQQFSEDRLLSDFCRGVGEGGKVVEDLLTSVEDFIGGTDQFDDITMICVRREMSAGTG